MRVFEDLHAGRGDDRAARRAGPPDKAEIGQVIGARIRRRRRQMGLTQAQLAQDCGVCFQQIQKYEGGGTLSVSRLLAIARALRKPMTYFFDGLDEAAGAAVDPIA